MNRWIGLLFLILGIIACDSSASSSGSTSIPPSQGPTSAFTWTPNPTSTAYKSPTAAASVTLKAKAALNIRSGPGTGYQILDVLKTGDTAQVIGQNGNWWNIRKDELAGWVTNDSSLVEVDGDTSQIAQIDAPPTAAFVSAPNPAPISPQAQSTNPLVSTKPPVQPTSAPASASCPGFQYTCDQLTCAQAYACLKAGNKQLDANHDGIPCNSKCA